MPCWEVRQVAVAIEAADLDALQAGLEREYGVPVTRRGDVLYFVHPEGYAVEIRKGKVILPAGKEREANRVKRAYAKEQIRRVPGRFGWVNRVTGENRGQLQRRF